MHYIYVPSEDHPADAPSRGVIRKITKKQGRTIRRGHREGPRSIKEEAQRARDSVDPIEGHLKRVAEVAAYIGDRGLCAKRKFRLRTIEASCEDKLRVVVDVGCSFIRFPAVSAITAGLWCFMMTSLCAFLVAGGSFHDACFESLLL